jgi:microcystin-dependent protein
MTEVYLGQIMMTGFGFPQKGFAQCNGQIMGIQQNTALFSLLGTYYGGNGVATFALPNLQGRTGLGAVQSSDPNWQPTPYPIGTVFGEENVTLLLSQLPQHTHTLHGTTQTGNTASLSGALWGQTTNTPPEAIYATGGALVPLAATSLDLIGGSTQHPNMQPFQVINFNIALSGVFPSRG